MPLLVGSGLFVGALALSRAYRLRGGRWVPGWIGGISLLALFIVFFVLQLAVSNAPWVETLFFAVVGLHVGAFLALSRIEVPGAWWQIWR